MKLREIRTRRRPFVRSITQTAAATTCMAHEAFSMMQTDPNVALRDGCDRQIEMFMVRHGAKELSSRLYQFLDEQEFRYCRASVLAVRHERTWPK